MARTNSRCPFYRGVRHIEVSVKRESTLYVYGYVFYGLTPMLMSKNVDNDFTTNPYTLDLRMSLNSVVGRPDTLINDYEDKFFLNWTLNFNGSNNGSELCFLIFLLMKLFDSGFRFRFRFHLRNLDSGFHV